MPNTVPGCGKKKKEVTMQSGVKVFSGPYTDLAKMGFI